ncbi:MAG TPA: DUF2000 domain-containing protein [Patescibacteria group bacterium]
MKKFVAILNKKIETGRLMNALGHMTAGLSHIYPNKDELLLFDYVDKEGGVHKSISDNPFIVLSSDNSNQIRTVRNALKERGIIFTDFTTTMQEGTAAEQRERTSKTSESELEYCGICFFGDDEIFKDLTKKFSLWR